MANGARLGALTIVALTSGCATLPSTRAPRTCVAEGPARPVELELDELVTIDRGVRWFHAEQRSLGGLAWLRADGELGFVALDSVEQLHSGEFHLWGWRCTPEGEGALRCFNAPMQRDDGSWTPLWSRRVELSDAPTLAGLERWQPPEQAIDRIVSDGRRAMTIAKSAELTELRLWDVAGKAPSGEPVRIAGLLELVTAWCAGACTLVARRWDSFEARGDASRLIAVTVSEAGARIRRIAPEIHYDVLDDEVGVVRSGDAVILAWQSPGGRAVQLAALGPSGRVRARARLPTGIFGRFAALDEGLLALQDVRTGRDDWAVLELSPWALVTRRRAAESDSVGLVGARFADGVLLAGLTDSIDYVQTDSFAFHSWSSKVAQRYLAGRDSTGWTSLLGDEISSFGDGRGGYDVAWLTRPDRAAAFLWPTGDAWGSSWLIPVRAPCP